MYEYVVGVLCYVHRFIWCWYAGRAKHNILRPCGRGDILMGKVVRRWLRVKRRLGVVPPLQWSSSCVGWAQWCWHHTLDKLVMCGATTEKGFHAQLATLVQDDHLHSLLTMDKGVWLWLRQEERKMDVESWSGLWRLLWLALQLRWLPLLVPKGSMGYSLWAALRAPWLVELVRLRPVVNWHLV